MYEQPEIDRRFDWDEQPVCYCEIGNEPDGAIICGKPAVGSVQYQCEKCNGDRVPLCVEHFRRISERLVDKSS